MLIGQILRALPFGGRINRATLPVVRGLVSPLLPPRFQVEPLEGRTLLSTVLWDGGPTGNGTSWSDPVNWAGDVLPGAADTATIGATGTSPLISISTAVNVPTILTSRPLQLSGGSLNNSTITSSGGSPVHVFNSGTLNGVTVNGDSNVTGNSSVTVTNGLALNGTLNLGSANGSVYGRIYFAGTQSLSGSGTVNFGSSTNNALYEQTSGTGVLTIASGITIQGGSGAITGYGSYQASESVVNYGTINIPSGQTLALGGVNWSNAGTINAAGATVNLNGSFTTAALGGFNASGATVYLNGTINNASTTLTLQPSFGGNWRLNGGTVNGGTIASIGGSTLILTAAGGTLAGGVTVAAGAVIDATQSSSYPYNPTLNVTNGLALNGTLNLGSANGSVYGRIYFAGTQSLSGSGTVNFGSSTNNALYEQTSGTGVLTIASGITIQGGSGAITGYGSYQASESVVNYGTINIPSGQTLALGGVNWSNAGTINAAGATVNLNGSFTTAALGGFNASGATVYLNGTINNASTTLTLQPSFGGNWRLNGGTVNGGTIASIGGSTLILTAAGGTLAGGVTVAAGAVIDATQSSSYPYNPTLNVTNGLALNGTLNLGSANGSVYGRIYFAGTQSLSGSGTVNFGSSTNNALYEQTSGTGVLTIASGITIQGGSGAITGYGSYQASESVVNYGTINIPSGQTLALGGVNWSNAGTINAAGATVNLNGSFTTAALGGFNASGATVYLNGTINNASTTLTLQPSFGGNWRLNGGTVNGGTIASIGGSTLILTAAGGTLAGGVTVAAGAVIDATQSSSYPYNPTLNVTNGLALNGTLNLGSANGSVYGRIYFAGTQSLSGSGTVNFGSSTNNALYEQTSGTGVLTIASGITIQGGSGAITGYGSYQASESVVNYGTINIPSGQTLALGGVNWSNAGTINAAGATVNLNGSFTTAALGGFNASGATVYLNGTINNASTTLTLQPSFGGNWRLNGGTVNGGTIASIGGSTLILTAAGGTLAGGVTVAAGAVIDATQSSSYPYNPTLNVTNGLALNGTLNLGSANGSVYGRIYFAGTQSLSGSGTVNFGSSTNNALYEQTSGTGVLTIASGITIQGGSGAITGYGSYQASESVVNYGNVIVLGSGSISFGNTVTITGQAVWNETPSASLRFSGSLLSTVANPVQQEMQGAIQFVGAGTGASPQLLEAFSDDLGSVTAGFSIGNFAIGSLSLSNNTYVKLVDQSDNAAGSGAEAIYVNSLVVSAGTTLNLNGLAVYARSFQNSGTIINGSVTQLPDSGPLTLGTPTPGAIGVAGELDEWSFFGRAGAQITVLLNPGSSGSPAPGTPVLSWARAQLLDAASNVLATASNTSAGQTVTLSNVTLPVDGTYRIRVNAPASHTASVGNYFLTAWDTTPSTRVLNLDQPASGTLATPYAQDQWAFAADVGQQVRFDFVAGSNSGLAFTLTGPNGYTGFTDIPGDSPLLTLPTAGAYTVVAHSLTGAGGNYAFVVNLTSQTDLALGSPYTGTLSASGQPRLFKLDVPANQVLSLKLSDATAGHHTELHARFNAPPTRETFDYGATGSGANQSVLVPSAAPGTWYILVYAESVPTPGPYTLVASAASARVSEVFPSHAGNSTPVNLTITGAGFSAGTTLALVGSNGTTVINPTSQTVDLYTQMSATFPAGIPADTYTLRATRGGTVSTFANALTVTVGGTARLETNLILPSALGRHAVATLYVEFANTGDVAMPAPLLSLQSADPDNSDKPILTLDQSRIIQNFWSSGLPPGTSNSVLILGSGKQAGYLNPGERIRVPVYYLGLQQPWNFGDTQVELEIRYWTESDPDLVFGGIGGGGPIVIPPGYNRPIDWSSQKGSLRPTTLNDAQWSAIYGNLTSGIPTTNDYVKMLNQNARFLATLGEDTTSVDALWNFEVQQAYGYTAVPTLDSATDASMPAPGVSLGFSRSFANSIISRNAAGPLGMGWYSPWQTKLLSTSSDLVQIVGQGGSASTFTRDTRNGSYFSGTGDSNTLVAIGGGVYELRAVSGIVTRFRADGKIDYVKDTNGNKVTAAYDGLGRLATLTHSSGASLTFAYNAAGLYSTVTDSAGRVTTYGYDATNTYLTSVTTPDGKVTNYTYQSTGAAAVKHSLLSIQRGGTTQFFDYDARGRLDDSYLAGNAQYVDYGYDDTGTVMVADSAGTTSLFFEYHGLLAKTTDPLGNLTSNEFNTDLRLSKTVAPTGESQSFTWCSCGSMTSVTNELGQMTTFTYDYINGSFFKRMTSFTDAKGNKTSYTYDAAGNLVTTVYPNNSVESLGGYTAAGLPSVSTNRRGQTLSYQYNAAGQVTKQTFSNGTFITFAYNTRGDLTTVTDGTQVTTYSYSFASDGDRLKRITYPNGRYLDYTYDSFGRRIRMTDQDNYQTRYEYDAAGRLYRLRDASDAILVTYTYDASGRLSRVDKGNGTFSTYEYDAAGQLLSLKNWRNATTLNSKFDYTYDSRGRRVTMATLDGTWTYGYDGTGQLTRAVFASLNTAVIPNQDLQYFYDAAGNRTKTILNGVTTIYAANNLNQYTSVGGVGQTYDADGNLTFDGVNTYAYDQQSRLVSVSGPQGLTQWEYDAFGIMTASIQNGNRVEKLSDPMSPNGLVSEYDPNGTAVGRTYFGLGLSARRTSTVGLVYFEFDGTGNVSGISNTSPADINVYAYLPFGEIVLSMQAIPNQFAYLGNDGVVRTGGDYLMGARHFSPASGRFLEADPLRIRSGDTNFYRYAINSPLNLSDPTGLFVGDSGTYSAIGDCFFSSGRTSGESWQLAESTYPNSWAERNIAGYFGDVLPGIQDRLIQLKREQGRGPNDTPFSFRSGFGSAVDFLTRHANAYREGAFGYLTCGAFGLNPVKPLPPGGGSGPGGSPPASTSVDPNDKIPGVGYGPQAFVAANAAIPYKIDFENDATATAPAQSVTITDQLAANFAWSTFALTEIGWGDTLLTIPTGTQHYQSTVRVTIGGKALNVSVEAGINTTTGQVFANFQSLDPDTQLPPDVLTGFLPPEDGTGRGMGHIGYSVRAKAGLPTGTQIRNVALISFDGQLAISTDQVDPHDPAQGSDPLKQALVTIDANPPTSAAMALPPVMPSGTITLAWSGQDDLGGSGVASYDVYVSRDSAPFSKWLSNTTLVTAAYAGERGHRYAFYTIAKDNAGNVELLPALADTQTLVAADFAGTAVPDNFYLRRSTDQTRIELYAGATPSGSAIASIPADFSQVISLTGLGGSDTFTLDYTNGNPFPTGGLLIDGGGQAGDLLRVLGSGPADPFALSPGQLLHGGAAISFSGTPILSLAAGTFSLPGDLAGASFHVEAGAAVNANVSQNLVSLDIATGGKFALPQGGSKLLVVNDLSVSLSGIGGQLDLADNALIVDYLAGSAAPDVAALVKSGRNGQDQNFVARWNGAGIISSAARQANIGPSWDQYSLGVLDGNNLPLPELGHDPITSFAGRTVDLSSVLVRYTYSGDADLNGEVNGDDYALIDNAFNGLIPNFGWLAGDLNFDGNIDVDDYALIDNGFLFQGPPIAAQPAPASAAAKLSVFGVSKPIGRSGSFANLDDVIGKAAESLFA